MPRESLLDALDLDPDLTLPELAEALREEAAGPDPARRELARRAFERLTESPSAHFAELMETVPRRPMAVTRLPRREPPARAPSAAELRSPLAAALGPPDAAERALLVVRAGPVDR